MNRLVSSHHISALPPLREIKTAWIKKLQRALRHKIVKQADALKKSQFNSISPLTSNVSLTANAEAREENTGKIFLYQGMSKSQLIAAIDMIV